MSTDSLSDGACSLLCSRQEAPRSTQICLTPICLPHVYAMPVNVPTWLAPHSYFSSPFSSPCFPCIGWDQLCSIPWTTCHNIFWQGLFPWKRMSPWVMMTRLYLQLTVFRGELSSHQKQRISHDTQTVGHSPCHLLFILLPPEEAMILTHYIMIGFVLGSEGKDKCRMRGCWMKNATRCWGWCLTTLRDLRWALEVAHLPSIVQYVVCHKLFVSLKLASLS